MHDLTRLPRTASLDAVIAVIASETAFAGIEVNGQNFTGAGTINANVIGNTVAAPLVDVAGGDDGIRVVSGGAGQNVCIDVFGNDADGSADKNGVLMVQGSASGTMRLERLASNQGTGGTGVVAAQLNGTNTLSPGALVSIASQITAVADNTCAVP